MSTVSSQSFVAVLDFDPDEELHESGSVRVHHSWKNSPVVKIRGEIKRGDFVLVRVFRDQRFFYSSPRVGDGEHERAINPWSVHGDGDMSAMVDALARSVKAGGERSPYGERWVIYLYPAERKKDDIVPNLRIVRGWGKKTTHKFYDSPPPEGVIASGGARSASGNHWEKVFVCLQYPKWVEA